MQVLIKVLHGLTLQLLQLSHPCIFIMGLIALWIIGHQVVFTSFFLLHVHSHLSILLSHLNTLILTKIPSSWLIIYPPMMSSKMLSPPV